MEVGYYEDNSLNRIIPIFLIIEVTGFPSRIEVEQAGKKSSPQNWGIRLYRISTSVIFHSLFQEYQDISFNISLFNHNEKTDVQTFSVRVFSDGYLGDSDMEIEEGFANEIEEKRFDKFCGNKYANQIQCTRYKYSQNSPYIYGPVYKGQKTLRKYEYWDRLIKKEIVTLEQKEIFVAMSENEGNLDTVQSYDKVTLTAGAMQKTINNEGTGEFPVQVWEFKENFPTKYEKLLKNCNWEVEEDKGTIRMYFNTKKNGKKDRIPAEKLKSYIRTTCNNSTLGKKVSCIPFLPIINLLNDTDFQVKQIEDFVTRLDTVLKIKPPNSEYYISQYVKSKLGKALFLDHHINAPEVVKWDLKKALSLFQQKNPDVSINPKEWGNKHSVYESELLEIYGPMRRMTDSKNRYNNLKKKL